MTELDVTAVYLRWTWARAVLHRGWWLATSIYLVVDARLDAAELVLVGVAQSTVALVFEVPAGVLADVVGRARLLVASHALMGGAMLATGLVTGFGPVTLTQMVWGLAWTLASGADVAWVSDETGDPARVAATLVRAGQAQLTGAVAGLALLGTVAWLAGLRAAMLLAGGAMVLLGLYVLSRFREARHPRRARRRVDKLAVGAGNGQNRGSSALSSAWPVLVAALSLMRRRPVVFRLAMATALVSGIAGLFGRVYPLRVVAFDLPVGAVGWLTVLGGLAYLAGALALRLARSRVRAERDLRRTYLIGCVVAAIGVAGLVVAPGPASASATVLLAAGALPLTRTVATVWANHHLDSAVRATGHSLLALAEHVGVIACGLAVAGVAASTDLRWALAGCATLLAVAALLVGRPTPTKA